MVLYSYSEYGKLGGAAASLSFPIRGNESLAGSTEGKGVQINEL